MSDVLKHQMSTIPRILLIGNDLCQFNYTLIFWCLCEKKWIIDMMINGFTIDSPYAINNNPSITSNSIMASSLPSTTDSDSNLFTAAKLINQYDFVITSDKSKLGLHDYSPTIIYINKSKLEIESIPLELLSGSYLFYLNIIVHNLELSLQHLHPSVFMASTTKKDNHEKHVPGYDDEEVDNSLKELLIGREHLTYGDDEVFFDAETPPRKGIMSATVSELHNSTSRSLLEASPQINSSSSISLNYGQYSNMSMNYPNSAPIQVKTLHDDHGNTYVMQSNGFVLPVAKPSLEANINPSTDKKRKKKAPKKKMFYHMPIPSNRFTPTEKLVESHNKVLQLVQYDEFLDQNSTSRYKDLDTSSFVLHSASSSSKDTSSKGSSSKGGSFKISESFSGSGKEGN